eukprot:gene6672-7373_t
MIPTEKPIRRTEEAKEEAAQESTLTNKATLCQHDQECFNEKCRAAHSADFCLQGDKCSNFACPQRHGKNRTRKCRNNSACFRLDCKLLHSVSSCLEFRDCKNFLCNLRHDQQRKAKCKYGDSCNSLKCGFLHSRKLCPNQYCFCKYRHLKEPIETLLVRKAHEKIMNVAKNVDLARKSHLEKLREEMLVSSELSLLMAPDQGTEETVEEEAQLTVTNARIRELREQLSYFDECVASQLEQLFTSGIPTRTKALCAARIHREIGRLRAALPALSKRREIEAALREDHQYMVVIGATGSGKSTQLPQYALETLGWQKRVLCTQPRKVSAISLAQRVASEWYALEKPNAEVDLVGRVVGYRVGSVRKATKYTRIEYLTEATLLTQLLATFGTNGDSDDEDRKNKKDANKKQWLEDVGAIIVDEAHERSITCDMLLAFLKTEVSKQLPHLKVIVTSATLDRELFCKYFDNCSTIDIPGRMFPVDVHYRPLPGFRLGVNPDAKAYFDGMLNLAETIHSSNKVGDGDILCFLTGQDEVEMAREKLQRRLQAAPHHLHSTAEVLCLYGRQPAEEQQRVFQATQNKRRIIFATDVAETGITIDGVRFVIDCGLCKESFYDSKRSMTILQVDSICQSSAVQRTGRAGRTAPGTCYRLYSEEDFLAMKHSQNPEVLTRPLELTLINVISFGFCSPETFGWIQPPDRAAVKKTLEDLELIGAISRHTTTMSTTEERATTTKAAAESSFSITPLGEKIAALQIDPSLARMIFCACKKGLGRAACKLAGVLSVGSTLFWRGGDADEKRTADEKHASLANASGDAVTTYRLFRVWEDLLHSGDTAIPNAVDQGTKAVEETDEQTEESLVVTADQDQGYLDNEEDEETVDQEESSLQGDSAQQSDKDDDLIDLGNLEDDDTVVTVASEESTSSFPSASLLDARETERVERNRLRAGNRKAVKQWCVENRLNNKALQMAQSTAEEIFRAVMRWNEYLQQEGAQDEPSDQDIVRMVCDGFFLNVAARIHHEGDGSSFRLLRTTTDVSVAFIHPGSCLNKMDDLQYARPQFVLYQSIMESTRRFLVQVTPIDIELIQDTAPSLHFASLKQRVEDITYHRLIVEHVSSLLAMFLRGKGDRRKKELEERWKCMIHYDDRSCQWEAWCHGHHLAGLRQELEDIRSEFRQQARNEWEEIVVQGDVRAVLEAGCVVHSLLFRGEFLVVHVSNLPSMISDSALQALLPPKVSIRALEIHRSHTSNVAETTKRITATVVGRSAADAKTILEHLQGKVVEGCQLKAAAGGISDSSRESHNSRTVGKLVMSWAAATSTGKAVVTFSHPEVANAVLDALNKPSSIFKQHLSDRSEVTVQSVGQWLGSKTKVPSHAALPWIARETGHFDTTSNTKKGQKYSLRFSGLSSYVDEVAVEQVIRSILAAEAQPLLQQQPIGSPAGDSDSISKNKDFFVRIWRDKEDLSLVELDASQLSPFASLEVLRSMEGIASVKAFFDKVGGRAGVVAQYQHPEQAVEALATWEAMSEAAQYHGQPLRVRAQFSHFIWIPCMVWKSPIFRSACDKLAGEFQRSTSSFSIRSIFENDKEVPKKDAKVGVVVEAQSLALLQGWTFRLQALFAPQVFRAANTPQLFTSRARSFLEERLLAESSSCVVLWDTRSRSINIYGETQAIKQAASDHLRRLVIEFETQGEQPNEEKELFVKADKRRAILREWKLEQNKAHRGEVTLFRLSRNDNTLLLHGSIAGVGSVTNWLQSRGYLSDGRLSCSNQAASCSLGQGKAAMDCSCIVCGDELEQPFSFSACEHVACTPCIKNMFTTVQARDVSLPIACFMDNVPMSLADIKNLTNETGMAALHEVAVGKFLQEHGKEFFYCPQPGCNQILTAHAARRCCAGSNEELTQGGVEVISCDHCAADYCLCCSSQLNAAVKAHRDFSCVVKQADPDGKIRGHVRTVQEEILPLRCPYENCGKVFLDWNGCCAVTCSDPCNGHFCGLCLEPQRNSSVCHDHVRRCRLNPRTDYFCSEIEIKAAHHKRRITALRDYLRTQVDKCLRRGVVSACSSSLRELGISIEEALKL